MSTMTIKMKSKQVQRPYQAINLQNLTGKQKMYLFATWLTPTKNMKSNELAITPIATTKTSW